MDTNKYKQEANDYALALADLYGTLADKHSKCGVPDEIIVRLQIGATAQQLLNCFLVLRVVDGQITEEEAAANLNLDDMTLVSSLADHAKKLFEYVSTRANTFIDIDEIMEVIKKRRG